MLELVRRAIGKVVRWSTQPRPYKFATQGRHLDIAPTVRVSYPERLFVGEHVRFDGHCFLNAAGGIRVGDGTGIGPWTHIYSSNHRYEDAEAIPFDNCEYPLHVDIGANVWIGADVIIVPGVTIGEGAVVAAGALVVKHVPAGAVVGGCPAKILKHRDMARYQRLKEQGKLLWTMRGFPGEFTPTWIGQIIPPHWYTEAGLPVPPESNADGK